MAIVKISWSGGKDSTCDLFMHLEQGDEVKAVCYIPMFTTEIPLIGKDHYEFILKTADTIRGMGGVVHIVSGMTYMDFFLHRSTKGECKGRMFCFPLFQKSKCAFKNYSKQKALDECDVGYYDYLDIGIAYDEKDRQNQLTDKIRSILVEQQITEAMAMEYCKSKGILSPIYAERKRDGCALCPNADKAEHEKWFNEYPEARELVIALQNIAIKERPGQYPLRNHEWFIWQPYYDGYQMTLADCEVKQ